MIKIVELEDRESIERELLLVKVKADADTRGQVLDAVQLFRAKVVDVAPDAVTIEVTGNAAKLKDFLAVLEPFGIRELVQSGMVAIGRGSRSITERTLRPVPVPVPAALRFRGRDVSFPGRPGKPGAVGRSNTRQRQITCQPHPICSDTVNNDEGEPPWLRCSTTTTPTCP